MRKVFKLTSKALLTDKSFRRITDTWDHQTKGTDLEGSPLIILDGGLSISPLSENAVLKEASVVLERRGKSVYARELRKLAGE